MEPKCFIALSSVKSCKVFKHFSIDDFYILPNWKLRGQIEYLNRLGPYVLGGEIKSIGTTGDGLRLNMQKLVCEAAATQNKTDIARVSGVMRLLPPTMTRYKAIRRTGLSGLTLSVEGIWNSSTEQLHMIGCLEYFSSGSKGCNSQVSLYFPRSLSCMQRSIIFGSISSTKNTTYAISPVVFGVEMSSPDHLQWHAPFIRSYLSYSYSRSHLAYALMERSQSPKLLKTIKQTVLRYPFLEEQDQEFFSSLNLVSDDLRINAFAGRKPFVMLEVLSLGPLVGRLVYGMYKNYYSIDDQAEVSKYGVLNVSLHLTVRDEFISEYKLEGLYDPLVGKMYLSGCRKTVFSSTNIDRDLDCLIEVDIEGSPSQAKDMERITSVLVQLYSSPIELLTECMKKM